MIIEEQNSREINEDHNHEAIDTVQETSSWLIKGKNILTLSNVYGYKH